MKVINGHIELIIDKGLTQTIYPKIWILKGSDPWFYRTVKIKYIYFVLGIGIDVKS